MRRAERWPQLTGRRRGDADQVRLARLFTVSAFRFELPGRLFPGQVKRCRRGWRDGKQRDAVDVQGIMRQRAEVFGDRGEEVLQWFARARLPHGRFEPHDHGSIAKQFAVLVVGRQSGMHELLCEFRQNCGRCREIGAEVNLIVAVIRTGRPGLPCRLPRLPVDGKATPKRIFDGMAKMILPGSL